jgi:DNA-binding MarR family transcriptional regulator
MPRRKLHPVLESHRLNWPETFDLRIMSLLLALQQVHVAESASISWVMARHRLSWAEFDALATLRRAPPRELTPSELQRAMVITSGGLSKVLQQLERRGLVERSTTDADRRIKPVRLTDKGAKLIEQAMVELLETANAAIRPQLTNKEVDQLVMLLEKLAGMGSG